MDLVMYIFPALFSYFTISQCFAENLSRGFNDDIHWIGYKEGLEEAKSSGKPIMMLVHKSWCGACKALKPKVATSLDMEKLSSNFVMINIEDNEENDLPENGKGFQPDGGYIPRIMFLDSDGTLRKDIINEEGNPKYKYYYSDEHQIVSSMKKAMKSMPVSRKDKEL